MANDATPATKKKGMCSDRHAIIVWINLGLSINLIVFSVFAMINIKDWFTGGVFISSLFPIYYA